MYKVELLHIHFIYRYIHMTTLTNKQLDQQRSEYRTAQRILLDIEAKKLLKEYHKLKK